MYIYIWYWLESKIHTSGLSVRPSVSLSLCHIMYICLCTHALWLYCINPCFLLCLPKPEGAGRSSHQEPLSMLGVCASRSVCARERVHKGFRILGVKITLGSRVLGFRTLGFRWQQWILWNAKRWHSSQAGRRLSCYGKVLHTIPRFNNVQLSQNVETIRNLDRTAHSLVFLGPASLSELWL